MKNKNERIIFITKAIGISFSISLLLFLIYIIYLRPIHLEFSVVNSVNYTQKKISFDSIQLKKNDLIILSDSRLLELNLDYLNTINLSIGGETSKTLNYRIKNYDFQDSSSIILSIGLNDLLFSYNEKNTRKNLKNLLDHLCSKTQHSDVFICKILPINVDGFFFDKEEVNNNISSLNLFFDTICLKNNNRKKVINFGDLISSNQSLKAEYTYDGIHFNKKGIERLKSMLVKEITHE